MVPEEMSPLPINSGISSSCTQESPLIRDRLAARQVGCAVGTEDVVLEGHQSRRWLGIHEWPKRPRPPPGLLLNLPCRGVSGVFTWSDASQRNLPAPRVGDEAMPPHEQHTASV